MARPKAKTIIERHGFKDEDKKTMEHDKIQIWVYENAEQILKESIFGTHPFKIVKKKWESPILKNPSSNYKQVVGFIDLRIDVETVPLRNAGESYPNTDIEPILIEIKSKIPNLGELIRQINFYREYQYGYFLVVSSDDRFSTLLKEQGISFYKYKDPEKLF